jgi:hypothetical protein
MIENNNCPKCKYVYEITWDDDSDKYYNDYDEELIDEVTEELYPEYCPFCGTHRDYCSEEDASDIFLD